MSVSSCKHSFFEKIAGRREGTNFRSFETAFVITHGTEVLVKHVNSSQETGSTGFK